jgi:hypothetical protein
MRRKRTTNPLSLWLDCNAVIAKRLTLFAQGGARGRRESVRMVTEKMQAAARAQRMLMGGKSPDQVMRMVARKVRANRKRL